MHKTVHRVQKLISFTPAILDNFIAGMHFRKIGLALAFSPRMEALLAEAARLKKLWNSELVLIHVGRQGEKEEKLLNELMTRTGLNNGNDVRLLWASGKPADQILRACRNESVDLLIAGALRKENLVQFYLGTIARKILRKADCSVLMFTDPSTSPQPLKNIIVNAEDSPYVEEAIKAACEIAKYDRATWLHIVKEIRHHSMSVSVDDHNTDSDGSENLLIEEKISDVEKILQKIPHGGLKINVKVVSGKGGFEIAKFTQRKQGDLLVVGASPRRSTLFDRVFPHDLEYIFKDLPCNLLIVHPDKT